MWKVQAGLLNRPVRHRLWCGVRDHAPAYAPPHASMGDSMRSKVPLTLTTALVAAAVLTTVAATPAKAPSLVAAGVSPVMESIGPLAIGTKGILSPADPRGAKVFALDLSKQPPGAPGTKDIAGLDGQIAATLGTAASEITIVD